MAHIITGCDSDRLKAVPVNPSVPVDRGTAPWDQERSPGDLAMATGSRKTPKQRDQTVPISPPDWLPLSERALQALVRLPANWNSYGARPIRAEIVAQAADLLRKIARPDTPQPAIVPTVRGGVQLEWHTGSIDLEIEIEEPGQVHVSYEEPGEGVELETELTLADLPRLRGCVRSLDVVARPDAAPH